MPSTTSRNSLDRASFSSPGGAGGEHRDRCVARDRGVERGFESVVLFELERRDVAERLIQPAGG
jgi:hypothetical protein